MHRDTKTGQQTFMIGHGNNVTCLDLEKCGRYIASGAMNYMGFKVRAMMCALRTFFPFIAAFKLFLFSKRYRLMS
jgi:hypothetical protein